MWSDRFWGRYWGNRYWANGAEVDPGGGGSDEDRVDNFQVFSFPTKILLLGLDTGRMARAIVVEDDGTLAGVGQAESKVVRVGTLGYGLTASGELRPIQVSDTGVLEVV